MEKTYPPQVKQIFQRLNEQQFRSALELLAQNLIETWTRRQMRQDTEWMTARNAVEREARIEALTIFLNELERAGS